jgi:hypothetical protein
MCSCSNSPRRLIIIATLVSCQLLFIQGTGLRLKACLLYIMLSQQPAFYIKACLLYESLLVLKACLLYIVSSSPVRLSWCYKWEDFMGVCRSLANSCKQSGHGVIFCVRLLEKYRVGLHLELSKAESEYVHDQFR